MPRQTLDSDPLSGANNTDLGSEWDAGYTGRVNLQLLSNTAQATVIATRSLESFNATTAGGDQWAAVTLTAFSSAVYTNYAVICRASAPPTLSGYGAFREASTLSVVKWTGGTISTLNSGASARAAGEVLSLECVGTTITAFINGVSIASASDATYASGRAGIGCYVDTGGATSYCQLNTFQMGDFTTGGATHVLDADTVSFDWDVQAVTLSTGGGTPSGAWPNRPTNSTLLVDFPFASRTGSGMDAVYPVGGTLLTNENDPESAPTALQYFWTHTGPGNASNTFYQTTGRDDIYTGYWWKPSNPFTGWHTNQNKIGLIRCLTGGHIYMLFTGPQGTNYVFSAQLDFGDINNGHVGSGFGTGPGPRNIFPNQGANASVVLGAWNRVEWYAKKSTNQSSLDGILRWWKNGTLLGNYTNLNYPDQFYQVMCSPVWDGAEPNFPNAFDTHRWGHIIVTTGGTGSGGSGGGPPEVLPAPENLSPFSPPDLPYGTTTFSWDAVGGAVGYALRVHKLGTPYEPTSLFLFYADVTTTSHVLTTEASSSYDWWVHAINSAAELGPANGRTFSTTAIEVPPDPDPDPDPDPPPDPPVDPPTVVPPPVVDTPTTSPDVLPSGMTTVVEQDRLNPIKKEFRHYG